MTSSRTISVEDPDAVKRAMQRLVDLVDQLPSRDEVSRIGGTQSYYGMNYSQPLWSRAFEMASVTDQLAQRIRDLASQVDTAIDTLVKTDQEADAQARRITSDLGTGGGV
ncbi:hypothetical protein [Protaetiibacter intestinalis]|uniref:WXG100 family type VII secretion target n=1 Tax=Protaetiibacter intestinalis TaxID=2419774 RepID=A0A387B2H0_9MICO|nr:hypothetical protein [Protaetiibacter intestinalis]AYF97744.1 hypothetical protein D7I47_05410 [Protaetiibacter intestinalis]